MRFHFSTRKCICDHTLHWGQYYLKNWMSLQCTEAGVEGLRDLAVQVRETSTWSYVESWVVGGQCMLEV
jgi:hypothetical protein